jgi:chlorobactene glucosyltransferase
MGRTVLVLAGISSQFVTTPSLPKLGTSLALRAVRLMTLYHFIVVVLLMLMLANVLANLAVFDGLRQVAPPSEGPVVSVLVPARNEERNIEECIRSLLLQDYPSYELIVLDDHSSDRTAEIADRLIGQVRNPRVTARLLRGQALPEGWTGKNWACHQLAEAASGDFLWFTDADTIHAPGTVSAAVDYACRHNAGLVSAWPKQITETLGEKLVVPVIILIGIAFCPLWLQRLIQYRGESADPRLLRRIGAANGQFMFFTRACYDAIGGHASVRDHVVEDVALGREVSARVGEGWRLFNCDALRFSTVRMYRSFGETWEGFTKNIRAVFEDQGIMFWVFGLAEWALMFAPFIFLATAPAAIWHIVAVQVALIFAIRFLVAARFRSSWLSAALHPIGILLMMLIGLNSWRKSVTTGVTWKGRVYKPSM